MSEQDETEEGKLYRARELKALKKTFKDVGKLEKKVLPQLDVITAFLVGRTRPLTLMGVDLDGYRAMHMQMRQRMMFIKLLRTILNSEGLVRILAMDWFKLTPQQKALLTQILERKRQIWEFIMYEMRRANEMAIARNNPNKTRGELGLKSLDGDLLLRLERIQENRKKSKGSWVSRELDRHKFEIGSARARGRERWTS